MPCCTGRICQRPRPWPQAARAQLEAFKTPRRWWRWQGAWPQTRSGKTDTAALQAAVAQALAGQPPAALQPWR